MGILSGHAGRNGNLAETTALRTATAPTAALRAAESPSWRLPDTSLLNGRGWDNEYCETEK